MNSDSLDALWNSAANQPAADAGARLAAQFVARLRRQRRREALWLGWTFLALASGTMLAVTQLGREGVDSVARQWALLPLLLLPWTVAFVFLRNFRRDAAPRVSVLPLRAALNAAQAANRAERRRLASVGGLLLVMLPVVALAVWQLHAAGKATADQAWSMALVFGTALALAGAGGAVRYFRYLVPERCRLETLLRHLDAPPAP